MARRARIKEPFGIFYIHQTGSGERSLFRDDHDRSKFLEILKRAQIKFEFKLYAYCLLTQNEYHLVLDSNGSDISNIMKSINIGYAMYAKCAHQLFRDRYKSQLLHNVDQVREIFKMIHDRGQDGSIYNSYCHYTNAAPIKLDWVALYDAGSNPDKVSSGSKGGCKDCIRTMAEAKSHLKKLASEAGLSTDGLLHDKQCRNELIKDFRKHSTLSLKELGSLFGGLSESSVCKILNK